MRSSFFGLHVAASGLNTARGALNVTSHNIANAELPGFSRQVAQMQAARPLVGTGRGMYGTGSQITSVIQIRDRFLDKKFWNQSSIHGRFTAINSHLNFVETVFNQLPNAGVKRTFNGFFSTLHDLTTRAHEPTFRTNVVTNAHTLTEQIRQNAAALQRQQSDVNREFADVIAQINSLGSQIASLNNQIHIFERDGSNANDLRDQRALLIDELSTLVNISVEERDFSRPGVANDRRMTIMINGQMFVDHRNNETLELVARDNPHDPRSGPSRNEMDVRGLYDVFFVGTGSRFNIHSPVLGGKLRGIVDVRDGNGGQHTVSPILTGQMMVQRELDSLERAANTLRGMEARLVTLNGQVAPWTTDRDTALAAIEAIAAGSTPAVTNTATANARIAQLFADRAERDAIAASLPTLRGAIVNHVNFQGLRNAIGAEINLNSTAAPTPAINTALNNIQTLLNEFAAGDFDNNLAAFTTQLDALLTTPATGLHDLLDSHPDFDSVAILNQINGIMPINTAPLSTAITDLAALTPPARDIDAQLAAANAALLTLNAATNNIAEIVGFAERLERQLDWTIAQAEIMEQDIIARIASINAGTSLGVAADYEDFLDALQAELVDMRATAAAVSGLPSSLSVYDPAGALTAAIAQIQAVVGAGGIAGFIDNIENILDAAVDPVDGLPVGLSQYPGATSTFKGIPFYMNQLNELVRVFARAMNEGRNRDGGEIPGAIGHLFGFDANGENRQAMFFTFQDSLGNPATVTNPDDPLRNLRMWILADPADPTGQTPLRDANGYFVTVMDPDPPMDAAGNSIVARDATGNPMFTLDYSQFNALNFIMNPELMTDPDLLAASSNANIGQANNDIIHGFLAVANDQSLFREGRLIDFIIATSNHLAVDNNQAQLFRESYHEITMATHNHRLSVKSVDTEEEMLNLVRFQNMFIASSRLINVLDTVYDTLINRLGNF
ncbi:MAG: flagellar hook-associated protein FlgK [Defluviitaleaceae bacterium]|nr:flagellar hook-associated protein FlgK [Defluviitaleaceae bacterium]